MNNVFSPFPKKPFYMIQASCLTLLCVFGCNRGDSGSPTAEQRDTATEIQLTQLKRGEIARSITLPGTIIAYQSATLYAKIPGYLKKIAVDKGDSVKEGDFIAEIEAPELLAELPRYEAEAELAEVDFKRLSQARAKSPDLVVPLQVDEAKAKHDVALANLKRINYLLGYTKISAPFSGIVTRRWVDPGAFIPAATSGSVATSAAIITLMDFSQVRIDVAVPEPETPFVSTETSVAVTVDELPERVFKGNVTRYEYALDPGTRTMIAEIEIPNPKLELRPGMYAILKIEIERKTAALIAPINAVAMEKTGSYVFIVEEDKVKKVPVKTGFNDGSNVEITSGVSPDQSLIVIGKKPLQRGQAVRIKEGN